MKLYTMRSGNGIQGLRDLMQELGDDPIVMAELGSFAGESATIFLEHSNVTKLYCVDRWTDERYAYTPSTARADLAEPVFDQAVGQNNRVIKIKNDSVLAAELIHEPLDLVYIDACHTFAGVVADIEAWIRLIRSEGWIAGHDWNWSNVKKGVQSKLEHLGTPKTFCDNSWLYRLP